MTVTISDVCAVIPAAGLGLRMQLRYPKQYISIKGKTILEHSISTILTNPRISYVVIVVSYNDSYFAKLTLLVNNPQIVVVKRGGINRASSVLSGIQAIDKSKHWVLVHDSNRPCLHQEDLEKLLSISKYSKVGGILATPVHNTVKRAELGKDIISHTVDRTDLWQALTPQLFPRELLYKCLLHSIKKGIKITDEASAMEYCGFHPELIKGRADNIKITYEKDLQLAKFYLENKDKIQK